MTDMNLFANRPTTKLAAGITPDSTTLSLAAGTGSIFPNPGPNEYFRLVVQKGNNAADKREYMRCTARSGDVLTVERGQEGTIATNFAVADEVSHVVTAQSLNDIIQSVVGLETSATKTTIDDTPPASPDYADRWIKPSTMTEMVWVPNAGTPGAWINPADAGSLPLPVPISKGGTGGTTPEEARANLGISSGGGGGSDPHALPDGDATAPSLAFAFEPGLGMYRLADHDLGFTAAGSTTMFIDAGLDTSTSMRIFPRMVGDLEDASRAVLELYGDPDSGPDGTDLMYMVMEGQVGGAIGAHHNTTGAPKPIRYLAQTHTFERGPVSISMQQLLAHFGNVSAPGVSFNDDTDTGMYSPGDNTICFATGGVERMRIADDGTVTIPGFSGGGGGGGVTSMPDGTEAAPGWAFANKLGTGFFRVPDPTFGYGIIGFSLDGAEYMRLHPANGLTLQKIAATGTITSGNTITANTFSAVGGSSGGVAVQDGTAAAPSIRFNSNNTNGLYYAGTNQIGIATAAVNRMLIQNSGVTFANAITVNGSSTLVGTVSCSGGFSAASNSSVGGTFGVTNNFTCYSQIKSAQGTRAAPGYTWDGETDTGIYRQASRVLRFSIGDSDRLEINSTGVAVTGNLSVSGTITSTGSPSFIIPVAVGDETTALATGSAKVTFRMPKAMTLTAVRGSLTTAQTSGSLLTFNVKENGVTVFSTKPTFDNAEKTTTTAAAASVLSDTALADDAEITIDIDQVGDGTAKGLKVYLIGN